MLTKQIWRFLALLTVMAMVLVACAPAAAPTTVATQAPAQTEAPVVTEAPPPTEATGSFQIPEVESGKFNVAMVLIGPHDDGGWSQAHYEGLDYLAKNVPNTHVAYIENVPEGADSEQVFRSLARKGFDLILGTSFGYMDPMETVANEFPDQTFIHVSGYKSNMKNFGNLFGAMENMKYLAGMVAGARAKSGRQSQARLYGYVPHP